ncbi:MAG: flagellar FlbD family protein [Clostridiaceae bacterium]|nr:flagellar FlbD family protein [Clostridiaceae bacterium]
MIRLTRRYNRPFLLNSDLIETVEETPDTVITMTTGHKFLVEESAETIVERIIAFRAQYHICPAGQTGTLREGEARE